MNFKAKRCFLSAQQQLNFTPERIFPLLCPTREFDWIEGWDCELIRTESGFAELDCIFTTHFAGDEKEIWVVDRYEPNKLIQFIRSSESRVIRYSIKLSSKDNGSTTLLWQQVVTALNEKGNRYVENCSNKEFGKKINNLEKLLRHYLETGEMLKTGK
jgi:hypothetical protein